MSPLQKPWKRTETLKTWERCTHEPMRMHGLHIISGRVLVKVKDLTFLFHDESKDICVCEKYTMYAYENSEVKIYSPEDCATLEYGGSVGDGFPCTYEY